MLSLILLVFVYLCSLDFHLLFILCLLFGLANNFSHSEVRIEGLETLDYLDNLSQRERFTEQGDAITFESEVNYFLCLYFHPSI